MKIFFSFPQPQVRGTFFSRPQRFLVEAGLPDGSRVIAYCANPGSFRECFKKGSAIFLWDSCDPRRKRRYTWRAIKLGQTWIGTDTHLANQLIEASLRASLLHGLEGFSVFKKEPKMKGGGRLDFQLKRGSEQCFIEVKSATVVTKRTAQFPDSRSPRAIAHLKILTREARSGRRAVLLFLIQRGDVTGLRINRAFAPDFDRAYDAALRAGVEVMAVKHFVTPAGVGPPSIISILD
jgi:sugar fermentation stimulation protein A